MIAMFGLFWLMCAVGLLALIVWDAYGERVLEWRAGRHESLTEDEHEKLVKAVEVAEPLSASQVAELDDFMDFEDDVADPEMITAFLHWVQIHSDTNQDEERIARVRDEWEGQAA